MENDKKAPRAFTIKKRKYPTQTILKQILEFIQVFGNHIQGQITFFKMNEKQTISGSHQIYKKKKMLTVFYQ